MQYNEMQQNENGVVEKVEKGRITVKFSRKKQCTKCGGCLMRPKDMFARLVVKNDIGAEVGDIVRSEMNKYFPLVSSLIVWGVPILMLMVGIITGYFQGHNDTGMALFGLVGLAIGVIMIIIFDRVIASGNKFRARIVEIVRRANQVTEKDLNENLKTEECDMQEIYKP
ncbi:MAG: SoxR reducing system RseC family protein [Firmicutes bacterium]|nr:SoxR reducing system RseC family protein [Bacillota bacterium]